MTKALNEKQATVFKLRLDGLTFQQIGERLGISRQRAQQHFKTAQKKLKTMETLQND